MIELKAHPDTFPSTTEAITSRMDSAVFLSVKRLAASFAIILVIVSAPVLAGGMETNSCPDPTEDVRDALLDWADRVAALEGEEIPVPMDAVRSVQHEKLRILTSPRDERICRALLEKGHARYLDKIWSDEASGREADYPYYDAGYFEAGGYYFAIFTKTPTPQPDDLNQTRVVTGYSTAIVYDKRLVKIAGYSF